MHDGGSDAATPQSSMDSFLLRVAATDPDPIAAAVPRIAGRYEVGERIGRGGLGIVHSGWDPELRRDVALKFVRPDKLVGESGRALATRLRREARVLARLDHPAIVRVFDTGEADGQFFIAMEKLAGETLRTWARDRSWRDVLRACLVAASGLVAAHDAGVIHRDFKPDNVVVEASGRVVVLDFGLADPQWDEAIAISGDGESDAQRSSHRVTKAGTIVGTRGYLAPELVAGGTATHASDQYAFCATVHELLFGDIPAADASTPRRPAVPRSLVTVLRRGLADDPNARYESMTALVTAIEATRPLRSRALPRTLALAVVSMAVVAGVAELQAYQHDARCAAAAASIDEIWNDDVRADIRTVLAATGLAYADDTLTNASPWVDAYVASWRSARADVCAPGQDAALAERSEWCLEQNRLPLESMLDELAHGEAATIRSAVLIAAGLPSPDLCRDPQMLASLPEPPSRPQRAALVEVRRLLDHAAVVDAPDAIRIAEAALARARELGWPPLVLEAESALGDAHHQSGDYEAAVADFESVYFGAERIHWAREAALAAGSLASILGGTLGRRDDALVWVRHAEAALDRVPASDIQPRIDFYNSIGRVHSLAGEHTEALAAYRRAFEIAETNLGGDHPMTITMKVNVAMAHTKLGERAVAKRVFSEALAQEERLLGPNHPITAATIVNLGSVLKDMGDYAGSLALERRALAILEVALGPSTADVARVLNNIGNGYSALGQYEAATEALTRSLEIERELFGDNHPHVVITLRNLANTSFRARDFVRAREYYERARASSEHGFGAQHPLTALLDVDLGGVDEALGDWASAKRRYESALPILDGSDEGDEAYALLGLARVAIHDGEPARAIESAERAIEVQSSHQRGADYVAEVEFVLAQALWSSGRDRGRARELARHSLAVLREAGGMWTDNVTEIQAWLAAHDS